MAKYTKSTDKYQIPIFSEGNYASGAENARAMDIIENHLEFAMGGMTNFDREACAIVTEGTYSYAYNEVSATFSVTISSLEALIKGIHIYSGSNKAWINLLPSKTYYLFASLVESSYMCSSRAKGYWTGVTSETMECQGDNILLAKIICNENGTATIDASSVSIPDKIFIWSQTTSDIAHYTTPVIVEYDGTACWKFGNALSVPSLGLLWPKAAFLWRVVVVNVVDIELPNNTLTIDIYKATDPMNEIGAVVKTIVHHIPNDDIDTQSCYDTGELEVPIIFEENSGMTIHISSDNHTHGWIYLYFT